MTLDILDTPIDAVKGETNIFDFDANVSLDSSDAIWFTAKERKSDLDADAVIALGRNAGILTGITLTDASLGKFRVEIPAAATDGLPDRALVYDCKVKILATSVIQTVTSGVMYLADSVNHDAI